MDKKFKLGNIVAHNLDKNRITVMYFNGFENIYVDFLINFPQELELTPDINIRVLEVKNEI